VKKNILAKSIAGALVVALILIGFAYAEAARVGGYFKKNGTYVAPYYRANPNKSYNDNYSVKPNYNPYTGKRGTLSPTLNNRSPRYNRKRFGSPLYQYGR